MDIREGKVGALMSGIVLLTFPSIMFYLLFVEDMWEGTEFDWIGLGSGIVMLGLSLWLFWDTFSGTSVPSRATAATPLIDEWIGERGLEDSEIEQWRHQLDEDEDLLAIIAAWGDQPINRFAVTTRRIVLYSQNRVHEGVTLRYDQIASIEQTQHRFLQHLTDITLRVADGRVVTFESAGKEYATEVVARITQRQLSRRGKGKSDRRSHYCTQCGTPLQATDQFCGSCGSRR
jgi:hypothetical protein